MFRCVLIIWREYHLENGGSRKANERYHKQNNLSGDSENIIFFHMSSIGIYPLVVDIFQQKDNRKITVRILKKFLKSNKKIWVSPSLAQSAGLKSV